MVLVAPANSNWRDGFVGSCGSGGFFSSFSVDPLAVTAAAVGRRPPIPLLALGKQARGGERGRNTPRGECRSHQFGISLPLSRLGAFTSERGVSKNGSFLQKGSPPLFQKRLLFFVPSQYRGGKKRGPPCMCISGILLRSTPPLSLTLLSLFLSPSSGHEGV